MSDTRRKNINWTLSDGSISYDGAQLAVLMDIRDELQAIRARLDCYETREIPRTLRRIAANTARPRKKR